jgi:hypothetical protein
MTTTNVLIGLTVLPEVHVKMVLHIFLANSVIGETDATLFTLNG